MTTELNGDAPYKEVMATDDNANPKITGEVVELKRTLGLFNGIAIILGTIVGSGIFVSPKGVLKEAGSVGSALIIWTISGLICALGAHCFAELGTCIKKSGGMYAYIQEAFGDLSAFIYLWAALTIIFPAANAVIALTFAHYVLQPLFVDCPSPDVAVRLLAACSIALLTFVNCASVKAAAKVQDVFMIIKVLALALIIVTGIVVIAMGHTENFYDAFEGSEKTPGKISLAFYSGLFSYSGWYTLNFLTEELKNPFVNLPRAIWISMPVVTVIYVLTNIAYFAVLSPAQILASDAVAVTYAMKMYGVMAWIMPLFVACSTFGSLNGCIMSVARVFFVGARQGHLPNVLALVHIKQFTPFTAVLFEGITSIIMLAVGDVFTLINYVTFIESISFLACIWAQLYLRYKKPNIDRPIKVSIGLQVLFMLVCIFLVIFPLMTSPKECVAGIIILASGVPVYIIGVAWKTKPKVYNRKMTAFMRFMQKMTLSMGQESKEY